MAPLFIPVYLVRFRADSRSDLKGFFLLCLPALEEIGGGPS
jgi:hypothetical protein